MPSSRRLVCSATSSDNSDHATACAEENLLCARWELDTGLALVGVVADDGDVVARGTAQARHGRQTCLRRW